MKRTIIYFILILLISSCSQSPVDISEDIAKVNEEMMVNIKDGDVDAILEHYTEDAKVYPPNFKMLQGKDAIRQSWESMFKWGAFYLKFETISAEAIGNRAVEDGKYSYYTPDDQLVDEGNYIVEWKKVDGEWLMHKDIFNTNSPATGMTLKSGNMIGVHGYEIQIKEGYSAEEFEEFYTNELVPAYEAALPGVKLLLLSGERGQFKGEYGAIIYFESIEARNRWIPEPGNMSEEGKEAFNSLEEIERLREMVTWSSEFTDWVIL